MRAPGVMVGCLQHLEFKFADVIHVGLRTVSKVFDFVLGTCEHNPGPGAEAGADIPYTP
jgi:hypothetical protein